MSEFLCTACGKSFTQKLSLQKHFYAVHKVNSFTCKECGKVLKTKNQMDNHLHSHEKCFALAVTKKFPNHLKKAKRSLVSFNSTRAGFSPARDLTLRRKSSPHPPNSLLVQFYK